ncbi:MAG TPA: serine/threonine-protein kinase, partial [Nannocystis sp.]
MAGRYQLREFLGGGGVGQVFRAWDTQGQRAVALKVFSPARAADDALDRYARLVAAAGRAGHAGLVLPRGLGLASRNPPLVVMDSLTGDDAAKLRERLGRVPWMRALELCGQCAEILHAVYQTTRTAHRDLKPANIFITDRGEVRVLDYGVAEFEAASADSTRVDTALGVVDYRAPEQLDGGPTDERTDVFALGVILFELVTGQLPFRGGSYYEVARRILSDPPPRIVDVAPDAGVPVGVEGLIRRALGKRPDERFPDLGGMAEAIAQVRRFPGMTPGAPVTAAGTIVEVRGQPAPTVGDDDPTALLVNRPQRGGAGTLVASEPPADERTVVAATVPTRGNGSSPALALASLRPASATVIDPGSPVSRTVVDVQSPVSRTVIGPTTGAGRTVIGPTTGADGELASAERTVVFRQDLHAAPADGTMVLPNPLGPSGPPGESTMILPDPGAAPAESTMILPDAPGLSRQDSTMILPDPRLPAGETTMALPDAAEALSQARPAEATLALDADAATAAAKEAARPADKSLQRTLILVNVACGLLILVGLLV